MSESYAEAVVRQYLEATLHVAKGDETWRHRKTAHYRRVLKLPVVVYYEALREAGKIEQYWGTHCLHCRYARRWHADGEKCLFNHTTFYTPTL